MRTRIKICGLTREEDVALAASLGADALGFIFAPGPRQLTAYQARDLAAAVPPWVTRVGVFGPEQRRDAPAIAEACRLDTLQLHGAPDAAYCAYYRGRFSIIQALGIAPDGGSKVNGGSHPSLEALQVSMDELAEHVDGFLIDTAKAGLLGGTGETFDWSLLKQLHPPRPLIVAGGLTADNVRGLLAAHDPWGVDVSSGVESAPGQKDAQRLSAFIAAVR